MSKYDYLHALYQQLITVHPIKRNEIMRTIENKFRDAEDNGLSELSVTNQLGSPNDYAKQFLDGNESNDKDLHGSPDINIHEVNSLNKTLTENFQKDVTKIRSEFEPTSSSIGLTLEERPLFDERILQEKPAIDDIVEKETLDKAPILQKSESAPPKIVPTTYNDSKITKQSKVYITPQPIQQAQITNNPVKILLITFGLLLLNSIFVLAPFITIWALIISFVATGFALSIAGIGILLSATFAIPMSFISLPILIINHPILLFCLGFAILGIGGLLSISMIYSLRFAGILTARYASWNLRLIRGF